MRIGDPVFALLALVLVLSAAAWTISRLSRRAEKARKARCAFCDRDEDEVERLLCGPRAAICGRCLEACLRVQASEDGPADPEAAPEAELPVN
jgi:hypothetical protein